MRLSASEPARSAPDGDANDGDWLIWAFRVEPKTLNPISAEAGVYTRWVTIPHIFEPLLVRDLDTLQLKPHLARDYEVFDDGLHVTFHLREDARFSDGSPVTADDVVFTFRTIMDPNIDAANVATQYRNVTHVERVDDHTVRFHTREPSFRSVELLSFAETGILPEHVYRYSDPAQFNRRISDPVGSGPYLFEKWNIGRELILTRNDNYWGPKPRLRKVVYRFISEPTAAVQALRSGQVDIVIPEPEQFADLQADEDFRRDVRCISYWTPRTPYYYIGYNSRTTLFSDPNVRRAMTQMIDRRSVIDHLLQGLGRQITGPFCADSPANDPNIEPWPYDPEAAGRLLDRAGWVDTDGDGVRDKNGVPLRFAFTYSASYALYERFARVLKDSAERVGADVQLDPCEWTILWQRLGQGQFEAYIAGWSGELSEDPLSLFHSSQIGDGRHNFVGFDNPQADALMLQAERTFDPEARNRLYRRLHRILHTEQPYTFLYTRPTLRLVDNRFENVVVHKLGLDYLEWYVPKHRQRHK